MLYGFGWVLYPLGILDGYGLYPLGIETSTSGGDIRLATYASYTTTLIHAVESISINSFIKKQYR